MVITARTYCLRVQAPSAELAAGEFGAWLDGFRASLRDGAFTVHLSGCAKGCAHAAPAALTVVGTLDGCALIANGSAHDTPFDIVAADELPATIAKYARQHTSEDEHV